MRKKELVDIKKITSGGFDEEWLNPFRFIDKDRHSIPMEGICSVKVEKETFKPKKGDSVFVVDIDGDVRQALYTEKIIDNRIMLQSRLFRTRKDAEKFSKWEQASYRLRKRIWELNGNKHRGFIPHKENHYVYLNTVSKMISNNSEMEMKMYSSWFYLESEFSAKQLIAEMEDDLRIYLEY